MSSETPPGPPARNPAEPFVKGRITWGRPPQTVFRVGPLPRAAASAFVTPSARGSGQGILTGSMIPPTGSVGARPETDEKTVPAQGEPAYDPFELTPEPVAAESEPVVEPEAPAAVAPAQPHETVVEVEAVEPLDTVAPVRSDTIAPAAEPRSVPSVVVTPAIYASVSAALATVTKKDRWIIVAAVVAVIVTGGFIWLATLPGGGASELDLDAPPPAAEGLTVEVVDPRPAASAAAGVAVTPAAEAAPPPRARSTATVPPAATRPTLPVVTPPSAPTAIEPRPYIETAPLVVEPPTPAEPAPTDPDAPIPTQPQTLDPPQRSAAR